MDHRELHATDLDIDKLAIFFKIRDQSGKYWGEVYIHSVDYTFEYSNRTGALFRSDMHMFEFVRYVDRGDGIGLLELKYADEQDVMGITSLSEKYWQEILSFVSEWPSRDKFIRVMASDVT